MKLKVLLFTHLDYSYIINKNKKMPIKCRRENGRIAYHAIVKYHANKLISSKINNGIGSFYE